MKFEVKTITPDMAKMLLETNIQNNRRKDLLRVQRYSEDIKKGRWISASGDTIKLDETGKLIDGQHRLSAIILADQPVEMVLAKGVNPKAFAVIDTGKLRNHSDVFHIEGIKNAHTIPSMMRYYFRLKAGYSNNSVNIKASITNYDTLLRYKKEPKMWQMVASNAMYWYDKFSKVLPPSFIGAFYKLFYDKNPLDAEMFMNMLCADENPTSTVKKLRKALIDDVTAKRKMKPSLKVALIIKAWNAFREKKELGVLSYNENHDFPKPL